jgi:hypothetical protein
MSPITHVRFRSPVTLGAEVDEWSSSNPHSSAYRDAIKPRPGNPDLGEPRDSLIFEVRIGKPENHHDVEIPRGNIASITRAAPVAPAVTKEGKKP